MKLIRYLFVGLVLFGSNPTEAAVESYFDGNQLHNFCKTSPDLTLVYALGVLDVLRGNGYGAIPRICIPDNIDAGQLGDINCKYLRDHPEERHLTGWSLASKALYLSFPCKK